MDYCDPTIFNIIRWDDGSLGQMTHRSSIWCSKHYFFKLLLGHSKSLFLFLWSYKKIKIKLKRFLQRILQEIMKKMLGTSDTWSMSSLSHRTSDPAYYIEDWRILKWHAAVKNQVWAETQKNKFSKVLARSSQYELSN